MNQLAIDAVGPGPDPELAQWFTPPPLAAELVSLAGSYLDDATRRARTIRILEPSAGRGNLVRALRARAPGAKLDAVELDPRWAEELRILGGCDVFEGDYLARSAPAQRYDLAATNPPYDGGEEAAHLQKMLDECERVLALLPSRSLHGRERYRRVWHRFDPKRVERDWWVRQKVHCIGRPNFGRTGGGTDEIVLLDLRRGVAGGCDVRWL